MSTEKQGGFTYLAILFAIVILGIMLAEAGISWSQEEQREKEKQLLYVGNQYRQAIALYYQRTPGTVKKYPAKLEDLITDIRYNPPQHYLRKLYRDPVINSQRWGLVMAPEGGIMGVHSVSDAKPLKQSGFDYADSSFEGVSSYSKWIFEYRPMVTILPKP